MPRTIEIGKYYRFLHSRPEFQPVVRVVQATLKELDGLEHVVYKCQVIGYIPDEFQGDFEIDDDCEVNVYALASELRTGALC